MKATQSPNSGSDGVENFWEMARKLKILHELGKFHETGFFQQGDWENLEMNEQVNTWK